MKHVVVLTGTLGRDPDARYTPGGAFVSNMSVAVSDGWGDNRGTIWFKVTAWGKIGEWASSSLLKGSRVMVTGRLAFDKAHGGPVIWNTSDGNPRASFEVIAESVTYIAGPRAGYEETEAEAEKEQPAIPF